MHFLHMSLALALSVSTASVSSEAASFQCAKYVPSSRQVAKPDACDDTSGFQLVTPDILKRKEINDLLGKYSEEKIGSDPKLRGQALEAKFRATSNMNAAEFTFPSGIKRTVFRGSYQAPQFTEKSILKRGILESDQKRACMKNLVDQYHLSKIVNYDELDWGEAIDLTNDEKKLLSEVNPRAKYWEFTPNYGRTFQYKFSKGKGDTLQQKKEDVMTMVADIIHEVEGQKSDSGAVYIHCYGGHHRTGAVYGVMQKCFGKMPVDDIINEYKCHIGYESEQKPGGYHADNETLIREFPCDKYFGSKASVAPTKSCEKVKAAFDFGSGAFKMRVAEVDTCKHSLNRVVSDRSEKSSLNDGFNAQSKTLSSASIDQAAKLAKSMIDEARSKGAVEFSGVATQIFRDAKNGSEFIQKLKQIEPSMQVAIVSQETEARLGYEAALTQISAKSKPMVWDIGGRSVQLIVKNEKGQFDTYLGQIASKTGRVSVNEMRKKPLEESPNPISKAESQKGVKLLTSKITGEKFPASILKFTRVKNAVVVGVGPVHAKSILGAMNASKTAYTQSDVQRAIDNLTAMNDAAIQKKLNTTYPESTVTNLMLVLGYMKALKIEKVQVATVDLTDSLLVSESVAAMFGQTPAL